MEYDQCYFDKLPISTGLFDDRNKILELFDQYILGDSCSYDWKSLQFQIFGDKNFEYWKHTILIKDESEILSAVMLVPMELKVAETTVNTGYIHGVVTRPEFRKKGLMNRLMSNAVNLMEKQQPLGILWGYRDRYKHFGYEICGKSDKYFIPKRKFEEIDESESQKIRELDFPKDKKIIDALLRNNDINFQLQGSEQYKYRVFQKAQFKSYLYENQQDIALVTIDTVNSGNNKPLNVVFIGGRYEYVRILLNWLMTRFEYNECSVAHPRKILSDEQDFFDFYEWKTTEHLCNIRINSFEDLMNHLGPFLTKKLKESDCSLTLSMRRDEKLLSCHLGCDEKKARYRYSCIFSDLEMVKLLFGPEKPSELPFVEEKTAVSLDKVFPLLFHISPLGI